MEPRSLPFRPEAPIVAELAAGVVLLREQDDHVLLLHQREDDRWCLPKGHVDPGESLRTTAIRETEEETGIRSIRLTHEVGEVSYRFYDPRRSTNVHKSVVYFLGYTGESEARLESTFDDHRWTDLREAAKIVPFDTDRRILAAATAQLAAPPPTGGSASPVEGRIRKPPKKKRKG